MKSVFRVQEQNYSFALWKQRGKNVYYDIFMKWYPFPEEIKGEDDWIRMRLQEKYIFAETDTATTNYHFLCAIKNLGFIILQNIIKKPPKASFVGFFFKKHNKQKNKTLPKYQPLYNLEIQSSCLLFRAFWLFLTPDAWKHEFSKVQTCQRHKKSLSCPPFFCYFL